MDQRDKPKDRSVLLFSGGMDSLCAAHILNPDVLLYVRHGSRYEGEELSAINRLIRQGYDLSGLLYVDMPALGLWARPDEIIPMRNLFFLAVAAQYGERLYIGAMSGDRSLDKSPGFLSRVSDLFTYLYGEQHWCEPREFLVQAPFIGQTKTELVAEYLRHGGDANRLLVSFSCYRPDPYSKPCGQCKPCFRKWVALKNNGISTDSLFASLPFLSPWLSEVWPQVEAGTYRGREDREWVMAMGRHAEAL